MIAPSTVREERLKPRIRSVGIVVAAAAVAALFASPALAATSWGTVSSSYNGITRSTAFGTFYDDRATYATVLAHLNDTANDGDNVYVNADEYFWETDPWTCKSLPCWLFDRTKTSAEDSWFNTPVNLYLTNSLHPLASAARASIYTCVQLGWPVPGRCSPRAIVTFGY